MRPQRGAGRLRSHDLWRPTLRNPLADETSGWMRAPTDASDLKTLDAWGWNKKFESRKIRPIKDRPRKINLTRLPGPLNVGRCPKSELAKARRGVRPKLENSTAC
jgi:hypothetical protein